MGAFELSVFGTEDQAAIDALLVRTAEEELGVEVARIAWYVISVAAVAGLELPDGRIVVARAYQPNVDAAFLDATIRVQAAARAAGLPAAVPLTPALRTAWGLVRFEAELTDPGIRPFADDLLDVSAAGLAAQVAMARSVDPDGLAGHPMAPTGDLYPTPHSPIFDFEATATGAGWIDEIAAVARVARDRADRFAIVHSDWSARNIRIDGGRITAIYDWESAEWGPETSGLGVAAATWRSTGELGDPLAPGVDELQRYVAAYERHRGAPFTGVERRAALGAAVYCLAYTARCEHSIVPDGRAGRARARLDRDGRELLSLLDG